MKRLTIFFTLLIFSALFLKAQMNTGSKFVAGYSHFAFDAFGDKSVGTNSDPDKHFDLSLTTKAGYFLKNRIAIGALVDLGYSHLKYVTSDYTTTSKNFILGPLARYYVEYGSFIPFAEASVGFGMMTTSSKSTEYNDESKHSVFNLKSGIGANYFLNESIAIEGLANYYLNRQKPKGDGAIGEGSRQNGIELNIGVIYYFGTI